MEEDEISAQACKFPRLENGRSNPNNNILGPTEENGEMVVRRQGGVVGGGEVVSSNRFHGWHHHSSRIIRVSRASGGKDRHSKVMTSKGLRDRRVRLSVTTAIQFYDLQDRLGYDQPSKAVEWLIKAASDAISELPSLNNTFPDTPNLKDQPSDEKRVGSVEGTEQHHHQGFGGGDNNNADEDYQNQTQSQNLSLSKSACSSNSETSKGSGGLSLSRSEIRVKARERARERAAKEKEKENTANNTTCTHNSHNPISQTASFTELLTGGINTSSATGHGDDHHEPDLFNKAAAARQQWCTTTAMDYFNSGLVGNNHHSIRTHSHSNQASSGFSSGQIQLGNSCFPLQAALSVSPFNVVVGGENHQSSDQLQNFSSMPDHHHHHHHLMASGSSDYNLNFTISSSSSSAGLAGFNRGTLQSNSHSLLPHPLHQRFPSSSSSLDGSNQLPFFIGAAAPTTTENHHHQQPQQHFSSGFDGRLQLCYGDLTRHSDHNKGKGGKN